MKVLDLEMFEGSLPLYAAARKVEEVFSQADHHFQSKGAIAFAVPMIDFLANQTDVAIVFGHGVMVDHQWNEAETTACINRVLADGRFTNWFGSWMVADGTEYMKANAILKADMPNQKVYVFIPDIPVLPLAKILS